MNNNNFTKFLVATCMSALLIAGCGSAKQDAKPSATPAQPQVKTIKLAHVVNEKDPYHITCLKFKEVVEAKSKGMMKVDVFPNASLGDERALIEGMQMGTVHAGVITNGPIGNFLPELAVFEMPFLFANEAEAYKVLDGPVGQKMLAKFETINLKGLAFAERGFRNLTNSKRPVRTPADAAGLKIRVMENPVFIDTFKALGVNAVPMAWTEALTALQQKTIDGQENPVNVAFAFKLQETQKYFSMTKHTYSPATVVMSKKFFDSFDKPSQEILLAAAKESAQHVRKWGADQMAEQFKAIKAGGMEIITDIDTKAFQTAVKPVYDKYGPKFGSWLKEIEEAKKK